MTTSRRFRRDTRGRGVTAVFWLGLTTVLFVAVGPRVVDAEAQQSASRGRGDAGVLVSPAYWQYIDLPPNCCPVGAWVALGSGDWRFQFEYIKSEIRQEGYSGYFDVEIEGREVVVERDDLDTYGRQEGNFLVSWRAMDRPRVSLHVLFGAVYHHSAQRRCVAFDGELVPLPPRMSDPDRVRFRAEFTPDERRRCGTERPITESRFWPQFGVALDFPIGSRYFVRAETLSLINFRIGAGIRF